MRRSFLVACFQAKGLTIADALRPRFNERLELLEQLDCLRRDEDTSGAMNSIDA